MPDDILKANCSFESLLSRCGQALEHAKLFSSIFPVHTLISVETFIYIYHDIC